MLFSNGKLKGNKAQLPCLDNLIKTELNVNGGFILI